jgi:5,10-methylene-tetrahydrofolate dehydrogenase/methenyl tetrahydrofolate cyclohydrolase
VIKISLFNSKPAYQVTLEQKIKALREVGMNASADRLEMQLKMKSPSEKIKPMSAIEMKKKVKEHQAMGQMKV